MVGRRKVPLKRAPPRRRQYSFPRSCVFCDKVFKSSVSIEPHILSHTGERPYFCKHCGATFSSPSSLTCHVENVHLGIKYKCPKCLFVLNSRPNFARHLKLCSGPGGRSRKRNISAATVRKRIEVVRKRRRQNQIGGDGEEEEEESDEEVEEADEVIAAPVKKEASIKRRAVRARRPKRCVVGVRKARQRNRVIRVKKEKKKSAPEIESGNTIIKTEPQETEEIPVKQEENEGEDTVEKEENAVKQEETEEEDTSPVSRRSGRKIRKTSKAIQREEELKARLRKSRNIVKKARQSAKMAPKGEEGGEKGSALEVTSSTVSALPKIEAPQAEVEEEPKQNEDSDRATVSSSPIPRKRRRRMRKQKRNLKAVKSKLPEKLVETEPTVEAPSELQISLPKLEVIPAIDQQVQVEKEDEPSGDVRLEKATTSPITTVVPTVSIHDLVEDEKDADLADEVTPDNQISSPTQGNPELVSKQTEKEEELATPTPIQGESTCVMKIELNEEAVVEETEGDEMLSVAPKTEDPVSPIIISEVKLEESKEIDNQISTPPEPATNPLVITQDGDDKEGDDLSPSQAPEAEVISAIVNPVQVEEKTEPLQELESGNPISPPEQEDPTIIKQNEVVEEGEKKEALVLDPDNQIASSEQEEIQVITSKQEEMIDPPTGNLRRSLRIKKEPERVGVAKEEHVREVESETEMEIENSKLVVKQEQDKSPLSVQRLPKLRKGRRTKFSVKPRRDASLCPYWQPVTCIFCEAMLANQLNYEMHIRSHIGEKPFECSKCGLGFSSKSGEISHFKKCVLLKISHKCSKCGQLFNAKSKLGIHRKKCKGVLRAVTGAIRKKDKKITLEGKRRRRTESVIHDEERQDGEKKGRRRSSSSTLQNLPTDLDSQITEAKHEKKIDKPIPIPAHPKITPSLPPPLPLQSLLPMPLNFNGFMNRFENLLELQMGQRRRAPERQFNSDFFLRMGRYREEDSCFYDPPTPPPSKDAGPGVKKKYVRKKKAPPKNEAAVVPSPALPKKKKKKAAQIEPEPKQDSHIDARFKCPHCGKCFPNSGNLVRHQKLHTGEMRFVCHFCQKRFNEKCNAVRHIVARHHDPEEDPVTLPKQRGELRCGFCGETFALGAMSQICRHIITEHNEMLEVAAE